MSLESEIMQDQNSAPSNASQSKKSALPGVKTCVPIPPFPVNGAGSAQFSNTNLFGFAATVPLLFVLALPISIYWYPVVLAIVGFPLLALYNIAYGYLVRPIPSGQCVRMPQEPLSFYMTIPKTTALSGNGRIAIDTFLEMYANKQLELTAPFKDDLLGLLEKRFDWAHFRMSADHIQFFLTQWIPETIMHTRHQDEDQVREHYDRGDDFYNAFLVIFLLFY